MKNKNSGPHTYYLVATKNTSKKYHKFVKDYCCIINGHNPKLLLLSHNENTYKQFATP